MPVEVPSQKALASSIERSELLTEQINDITIMSILVVWVIPKECVAVMHEKSQLRQKN